MRPYDIGDPEIDAAVDALIKRVAESTTDHGEDLVREMVVTSMKMLRDGTERGDLKLMNATLKEMRYSFLVFQHYRDVRKVTMFGSARVEPHDPNYELAAAFAGQMVDRYRWMVVTGAGPGIMEAGNRGAGSDFSFGVSVRLPFEDGANPFVHESRLINYKYFFTRKLTFIKESDAFVLFPGGFGTLDESFELLTLIQTGKSDLHPVIMLEAPGTGFWGPWAEFVDTLVDQGMIAADDLNLFTVTTNLDEAIDEIRSFYSVYHSQRYVEGDLILRLKSEPSNTVVDDLTDQFGDIVRTGRITKIGPTPAEIASDDFLDLPRLRFRFDRRQFGRLRCLIDHLNGMDRSAQSEPQ